MVTLCLSCLLCLSPSLFAILSLHYKHWRQRTIIITAATATAAATPEQVHDLFMEVDEDGGGSIDFDEFMVMMADRMKERDQEEEGIEAFKVFDADASGYITSDELRRILMDLGEDVTEEEMDALILEADLDGNGRIDYDEFSKLVSDDFITGNAKADKD